MTVAYSLQASLTSHVHIHTLLCAQANEATIGHCPPIKDWAIMGIYC
jgi:hypothetical protein